jgi:hypothetical protein
LYTVLCYDKWGLAIYHCIHGTNSVEGAVHNPIRRNFTAMNASIELIDCLVADYRHRHNLDVGTLNKTGAEYLGHYDTWLDHNITKLRADINLESKPAACLSMQDTDPLDFPQTEEQFGITCIPSTTHLEYNFNGPCVTQHKIMEFPLWIFLECSDNSSQYFNNTDIHNSPVVYFCSF